VETTSFGDYVPSDIEDSIEIENSLTLEKVMAQIKL
jgi:hypothetical protein